MRGAAPTGGAARAGGGGGARDAAGSAGHSSVMIDVIKIYVIKILDYNANMVIIQNQIMMKIQKLLQYK